MVVINTNAITWLFAQSNKSSYLEGYTADDFLSNRIIFRDIVHPDDTEKAPQVPGTEIFGRTIPCDEIGGDYYDFIMYHNG